MSKTILVTGAAGFIGSNTVDYLVDLEYNVIGIDNFSSGKKENINSKIKFYECDISDKVVLEKVFMNHKIDSIVHLAAQSAVTVSINDPYVDLKSNLLGTINLMELMGKYDIKNIVYSSSGGTVYGEPEQIPTTEECKFNPISPYGITKGAAEWYIKYYANRFDISYTILRFPNVYGPRQKGVGESNVIAIFIDKMLNNISPTINGDGKYDRDYTYVKDIARAVEICINLEGKRIYNIGTGISTDVNMIYELLSKLIDNKVDVNYGPEKIGDVRKVLFDTSKIQQEIGWSPKYDLETGLIETIEWCKKNGK